MDKRGFAEADSNVYGFYAVRLKESLRRGTPVADTLQTDTLIEFDEDRSDVGDILGQIFGKRKPDTVNTKDKEQDSANRPKSPADLRKERREQKRLERERKKHDGL